MKIVVTDLTRFNNPDIVCLAGIEQGTGRCIRPMWDAKPGYFKFEAVKKHKILPGSVLEAAMSPAKGVSPPHIEDHIVSGSVNVMPQISSDEFQSILEDSAATTLRAGFGECPEGRCFPEGSTLNGSIITLKVDPQRFLIERDGYKADKFKASFTDDDGVRFRFVPVSDLGFSDHINVVSAEDVAFVELNSFIQEQNELYLRVGLSRPYTAKSGQRGCWIQLNGIYTFPNYREDLRQYDY